VATGRWKIAMSVISETYPDYKSATATCGRGYEDHDIAKVWAFKTAYYSAQTELCADGTVLLPEQALNTIVAVGISAGDLPARPLHVLDFGGGCGFHYFTAKRAFNVAMRWAVVETPTMAVQANEIANAQFEVYETLEKAASSLGRIDLVHTSGAVQYVPHPMVTLSALVALRANYVMLARFPVWHGPLLFGVQTSPLAANGLGPMPPDVPDRLVRYPVAFPNIGATLGMFKQGYDLIVSLPSPTASYSVRGQNAPGATFIFRAKSN
jgi:putative methyltransferase (TIGR04325 family)